MKRRVLFLEQYVKLAGGQKVLLTLINGLKDYYDFSVIVPEKGELTCELEQLKIGYIIFPIGYYNLGRKTAFDIFNYFFRLPYLILRLIRLVRKEKIDLVYANGARTFIWATIAASATKTPLIWHMHSIFAQGLIRKLLICFGKNVIVKKIIVVSLAVKNPLLSLSKKIELIYNAIDTGVYFPGKEKTDLFRRQLKIGDNFLIAMVGFIMEWKCVEDLIQAAKIVSADYPQAKFTIIGDVLYDTKGQKYKQYLIKLVDELDLHNNVLFVGYKKDIPEIMRELDIFVLASKKPDPCPTALLQAMASGIAVIATNFGGPAEIINDGKDGLLYPPNDYRELARKILFLLSNPKLKNDIANNAAQNIKANFNQRDFLSRIKTIIDESLLK